MMARETLTTMCVMPILFCATIGRILFAASVANSEDIEYIPNENEIYGDHNENDAMHIYGDVDITNRNSSIGKPWHTCPTSAASSPLLACIGTLKVVIGDIETEVDPYTKFCECGFVESGVSVEELQVISQYEELCCVAYHNVTYCTLDEVFSETLFCANGGLCRNFGMEGEEHAGCLCPPNLGGDHCEYLTDGIDEEWDIITPPPAPASGSTVTGSEDIEYIPNDDKMEDVDDDKVNIYQDDISAIQIDGTNRNSSISEPWHPCPDNIFAFAFVACIGTLEVVFGANQNLDYCICTPVESGATEEVFLSVTEDVCCVAYQKVTYCTVDEAFSDTLYCANEGMCRNFGMEGDKHAGCLCPPHLGGDHCEYLVGGVDEELYIDTPPPTPAPGPTISPYPSASPSVPFEKEYEALQLFYELTRGQSWLFNDGWLFDPNYCEWYGITCNENLSVTQLKLKENEMKGVFDLSILQQLSNLELIDLRENSLMTSTRGLMGDVDYFSDDQDLVLLPRLTNLMLDNNQLRGPIGKLSWLPSIKELHLRGNQFTMIGIDSAPNLQVLDLDRNYIQGTLQYEVTRLESLEILRLGSNMLSGTLYPDYSPMVNLMEFDISNNKVTGMIPTSPGFSENSNLEIFNVSFNALTGTIPDNLMKASFRNPFVTTPYIDVSYNALVGELPSFQTRTLEINIAENMLQPLTNNQCGNLRWNSGNVAKYGCAGIACPVDFANDKGRQTSEDDPCLPCKDAFYIGSVGCTVMEIFPPSPPPSIYNNYDDGCDLICYNGGFCEIGIQDSCLCPIGYSGKQCELRYRPTPPPSTVHTYTPAPFSTLPEDLYSGDCTFYATSGFGRLYSFHEFCGGGEGYADLGGEVLDIAIDPITHRAIGSRILNGNNELFEFDLRTGRVLRSRRNAYCFDAIEFANGNLYGIAKSRRGLVTLYRIDVDNNAFYEILESGSKGIDEQMVGMAFSTVDNIMYGMSSCSGGSVLYEIDLTIGEPKPKCELPECIGSIAMLDHGIIYAGALEGCIASFDLETCEYFGCDTQFGWDSHFINVTGLAADCSTQLSPASPSSTPAPFSILPEDMYSDDCGFFATSGSGRLYTFYPFSGGGDGHADLGGEILDIAIDPVTHRAIASRRSSYGEFELIDFDLRTGQILNSLSTYRFDAIEFADGYLYGIAEGRGGLATLIMIDFDTTILREISEIVMDLGESSQGLNVRMVGMAYSTIEKTMYGVSSCIDNPVLYEIDVVRGAASGISELADLPDCIESLTYHPIEDVLYGGTQKGYVVRVNDFFPLGYGTEFGWNLTGLALQCPQIKTSSPTRSPVWTPFYPEGDERNSLGAFYYATSGPQWVEHDNWLADPDVVGKCNWYGIECDEDGSVSGIDLSNNGLAGSSDAFTFLKGLSNLQVLKLGRNKLRGHLHIFDSISWSSMKVLDLSWNYFSSSIPVEIGKMTDLEVLNLTGNLFTYEFQEPFYRELTNLTSLLLAHNSLVGELPAYEGIYYPNLVELNVSHNLMKGMIPENLFVGNPNTLWDGSGVDLDISFNDFGMAFLDLDLDRLNINAAGNQFVRLDEIACLRIGWNEGDVEQFGCDGLMCNMFTYNLHGRQTSDDDPCIPCTSASGFYGATDCPISPRPPTPQPSVLFINDDQYDILLIFYRLLNGPAWTRNDYWLLKEISVCEWYGVTCGNGIDISEINLPSNNLDGVLEARMFARLPSLKKIDLSRNSLFGEIPIILSLELESINLNNNFLKGTILREISALPKLQELMLTGNQFSNFDMMDGGYQNLRVLDLSNNYLAGTIQYSVSWLDNLEMVSLGGNRLVGALASDYSRLENLATFDVSNNDLSGVLSQNPGFSKNPLLQVLNVSDNRFQGEIASDLLHASFQNPSIEGPFVLDFSKNLFEGEVPNFEVEKLDINVAGNRFSEIFRETCENTLWNNGDVGRFGCDAIACPVGTANSEGRQTSQYNRCLACPSANYIGTTYCSEESETEQPCALNCRNGGVCMTGDRNQVDWCQCQSGYVGGLCEFVATPRPSPRPTSLFYVEECNAVCYNGGVCMKGYDYQELNNNDGMYDYRYEDYAYGYPDEVQQETYEQNQHYEQQDHSDHDYSYDYPEEITQEYYEQDQSHHDDHDERQNYNGNNEYYYDQVYSDHNYHDDSVNYNGNQNYYEQHQNNINGQDENNENNNNYGYQQNQNYYNQYNKNNENDRDPNGSYNYQYVADWCSCPPGFTGSHCESTYDPPPTSYDPENCTIVCYNGGTCIKGNSHINQVDWCMCRDGMLGQQCEIVQKSPPPTPAGIIQEESSDNMNSPESVSPRPSPETPPPGSFSLFGLPTLIMAVRSSTGQTSASNGIIKEIVSEFLLEQFEKAQSTNGSVYIANLNIRLVSESDFLSKDVEVMGGGRRVQADNQFVFIKINGVIGIQEGSFKESSADDFIANTMSAVYVSRDELLGELQKSQDPFLKALDVVELTSEMEVCPNGLHCHHGSTCAAEEDRFTCDCSTASIGDLDIFGGSQCEFAATSFCSSNADVYTYSYCTNGGQCVRADVASGEPHPGCVCVGFYEGPHCEIMMELLSTQLVSGPESAMAGEESASSSFFTPGSIVILVIAGIGLMVTVFIFVYETTKKSKQPRSNPNVSSPIEEKDAAADVAEIEAGSGKHINLEYGTNKSLEKQADTSKSSNQQLFPRGDARPEEVEEEKTEIEALPEEEFEVSPLTAVGDSVSQTEKRDNATENPTIVTPSNRARELEEEKTEIVSNNDGQLEVLANEPSDRSITSDTMLVNPSPEVFCVEEEKEDDAEVGSNESQSCSSEEKIQSPYVGSSGVDDLDDVYSTEEDGNGLEQEEGAKL